MKVTIVYLANDNKSNANDGKYVWNIYHDLVVELLSIIFHVFLTTLLGSLSRSSLFRENEA